MDKKDTVVKMSLANYESLKEYQQNYKDMVREIKSRMKATNIGINSVEITIDKEKLEKFLFKLVIDDLEVSNIGCTRVTYIYK